MFNVTLNLSGERFNVVYGLTGNGAETLARAQDICVEQTIEFPEDLVPEGDIRNHILGRIESFQPLAPGRWEAVISFAIEITAFELTQLLNVVFGNFSLKPGVRVEGLELPASFLERFNGPRFGVPGLRELLGVPERPLFCAALKPMGLPVETLSELAYRFALGGVDLIKEDHGLTDQPFAPFRERVRRCAEAVERAHRETGKKCLYICNITAPASGIMERALFAKENGAGGVLVAPGLVGLDTMRQVAGHHAALPVISHPAFQGSFITDPGSGISHYTLFGQLSRLAGADAVIHPNYGGRFFFTDDDCRSIVQGTAVPMHHIKPIFPVPGGGMSLERIPEMLRLYGQNVVFLIGGALHRMGPDLVENCRRYMDAVKQNFPADG